MADKNNKFPENAPGAFYVDKECINCDACILVAENHFRANEEASFTYVYKQPETEEEIEACQEALEACPVEAIGKDGAESASPNQPSLSPQTKEQAPAKEGSQDKSKPKILGFFKNF